MRRLVTFWKRCSMLSAHWSGCARVTRAKIWAIRVHAALAGLLWHRPLPRRTYAAHLVAHGGRRSHRLERRRAPWPRPPAREQSVPELETHGESRRAYGAGGDHPSFHGCSILPPCECRYSNNRCTVEPIRDRFPAWRELAPTCLHVLKFRPPRWRPCGAHDSEVPLPAVSHQIASDWGQQFAHLAFDALIFMTSLSRSAIEAQGTDFELSSIGAHRCLCNRWTLAAGALSRYVWQIRRRQ
mmetsp:Transcript_76963/g.222530  ORF Transcript_76963/g.222530 Transcript_76963/m.222530 type:complete len:241 (-) Transcript_76963:114-836(-)